MSTYLNLLTDFGFKKIFADPNNKSILLDMLNTFLQEEKPITDVQIMKNEHQGQIELDRSVVFDLYCTNEKGEHIIVEVQRAAQPYFIDRTVFYSTFLIQEQSKPGNAWNFKLKPIYTISFLNFTFPKSETDPDKLYHKLQLREEKTGKLYFKKLIYIYVELPKFNKNENELSTHFDKWVFLLSQIEQLKEAPLHVKEPIFMELLEKAKLLQLSPEERARYDYELKVFRDNYNTMEYAKELATTTGMEKGMEKGSMKTKYEIILKGFAKGLSIQFLVELTALTEDEVIQVINNQSLDSN